MSKILDVNIKILRPIVLCKKRIHKLQLMESHFSYLNKRFRRAIIKK